MADRSRRAPYAAIFRLVGPGKNSAARCAAFTNNPRASFPKGGAMRRRCRQLKPVNDGLTFSEKVGRLGLRLKDPQWRRYGATLLAGKVLGLAVLAFAVFVLPKLPGLI